MGQANNAMPKPTSHAQVLLFVDNCCAGVSKLPCCAFRNAVVSKPRFAFQPDAIRRLKTRVRLVLLPKQKIITVRPLLSCNAALLGNFGYPLRYNFKKGKKIKNNKIIKKQREGRERECEQMHR